MIDYPELPPEAIVMSGSELMLSAKTGPETLGLLGSVLKSMTHVVSIDHTDCRVDVLGLYGRWGPHLSEWPLQPFEAMVKSVSEIF